MYVIKRTKTQYFNGSDLWDIDCPYTSSQKEAKRFASVQEAKDFLAGPSWVHIWQDCKIVRLKPKPKGYVIRWYNDQYIGTGPILPMNLVRQTCARAVMPPCSSHRVQDVLFSIQACCCIQSRILED